MKIISKDSTWWLFTLPAFLGSKTILDEYLIFSLLMAFFSLSLLTWAFSTGGGIAWKDGRNCRGRVSIPGPRGLPVFGSLFTLSRGLAHRSLAAMARTRGATQLMAFSLGTTPVVVSSDPHIAKEILTSPHFADRPIKQSARSLMFSRAIGFAPNGTYWRLLRRIASSHLFAPKRIAAHETRRLSDCTIMVQNIAEEQFRNGTVRLRKHLQDASLNNIMGSVFGKRYACEGEEAEELREMVREGFEILGAFNWSDHLPWLSQYFYDPCRIVERCSKLVPRVRKFVLDIIDEHKLIGGSQKMSDNNADFVHVLLSLDGEEKLDVDDMIAVLWEMIFRGTDTTALLTEWVMAELILHPSIQSKLRAELEQSPTLTDSDLMNLPYLQAILKETLRHHPPGPLLSWARLTTSDVQLSNGMLIPANTTAMVNMWAIAHDSHVWERPCEFRPERFLEPDGGDVDVRGGDLRLAPFGAGRRVCPGKGLGMVVVSEWVARLVHEFEWVQDLANNRVHLGEVLKLSCEMKSPLVAVAVPRA